MNISTYRKYNLHSQNLFWNICTSLSITNIVLDVSTTPQKSGKFRSLTISHIGLSNSPQSSDRVSYRSVNIAVLSALTTCLIAFVIDGISTPLIVSRSWHACCTEAIVQCSVYGQTGGVGYVLITMSSLTVTVWYFYIILREKLTTLWAYIIWSSIELYLEK